MVGLVCSTYSSSTEQIRCTPNSPIFSENGININATKCRICHHGPSTKHTQLDDVGQCFVGVELSPKMADFNFISGVFAGLVFTN